MSELKDKFSQLQEKHIKVEALHTKLGGLLQDAKQVDALKELIASTELRQINIVVSPPSGEALSVHITDALGKTYSYKTSTPTTMHVTAVEAALQHAENDVLQRIGEVNTQLDSL